MSAPALEPAPMPGWTPRPSAVVPPPSLPDLPRFGLLSLQEMADAPPPPAAAPPGHAQPAAPPLRGRWPEPEPLVPPARPDAPDFAADGLVQRARAGTEAALAR
ncbi:hypothetical protein J8J40_23285, partial [Mycobacterium tuberculosis]|nr:hypothetical protein [Mycobacterium tuberculosis]